MNPADLITDLEIIRSKIEALQLTMELKPYQELLDALARAENAMCEAIVKTKEIKT